MNLFDLLPAFPWEGPPFPRFLGIYWPWLQGEGGLPFLPMPTITPAEEPKPVNTYENIEEIELLDIDPELLMPRKIRIKRRFQV